MATLRESLQAEIATAESNVEALKTRLAALEAGFVAVLEKDVEEVKTWFKSLENHFK